MAQPIAIRRASIYHQRARQLAEDATREPREIERRHLLGLAAMYQRIADEMVPAAAGRAASFPQQQLKRTPTFGTAQSSLAT